jgi:dTDP-4-dehydrorhamnose 3,5-epimerase-like enzyme
MKCNLIIGDKAIDDRGSVSFVNDFSFSKIKRFYQVYNHAVNFIRAWHAHKKEAKYVYVASGSALIGAVDLESEKISKFVLSDEKPRMLYIPPNHANGFMNLSENTIIQFFSTASLEESLHDDIRFPWNKWDIWNIEYR